MRKVVLGRVCVMVASMTLVASAWSEVGNGSLSGSGKEKVSHCGGQGGGISVDLSLAANGTFSLSAGGNTYTGSYSGSGTAFTLSLDAGSITLLSNVIAGDASDLCGANVTVSSVATTTSLKLNKSKTAAKLKFAARATGSAGGATGTATLQIKAGGSWSAT